MSKSFKDFCVNLATTGELDIDDTDRFVPDNYRSQLDTLINIMSPRMNNLEYINIRFIEDSFEDLEEVKKVLNDRCNDIPDGIINVLSHKLYGDKSVNQLTEDERSIIKVLAVYLCIQK